MFEIKGFESRPDNKITADRRSKVFLKLMLIYDKISIGAKIKPWKIYANFHMDLIDTHLNREKNDKILIDNSLPMTDG